MSNGSFISTTSEIPSCKHGDDNHEMNHVNVIVSTIILTLLCFLGIFGNILVLLVYCYKRSGNISLKNRQQNTISHNSIDKDVKKRKNSAQSTQRHLILALATVDLVTCTAILPWDIFRSLFKYFKEDDEKFKSYADVIHLLDDLLDSLRNIAFAFEGCILSAIALDRYLTLTCNSTSKNGKKFQSTTFCGRLRNYLFLRNKSYSSENIEPSNQYEESPKNSETMSIERLGRSISESSDHENKKKCFCLFCYCLCYKIDTRKINEHYSTTETNNPDHQNIIENNNISQDCLFCGFRLMNKKKLKLFQIEQPIKLFTAKLVKANTRLRLVWLLIILLNLGVTSLEMSLVIVHYLELFHWRDCTFSKLMRTQINRIYLLASSLSILIIAYLYVRVFIAVHRQDVKNRKNNKVYCSQKTIDSENNNQASTTDISTTNNIFLENNRTNDSYKRKSFVAKFGDQWRVISRNQRIRARRTGLMLFISTVVFYATLFPLMWVHFSWWSEVDIKNKTNIQMHHEFYYVNNAINVLIYSFLNPNFRTKLHDLKNDLFKK